MTYDRDEWQKCDKCRVLIRSPEYRAYGLCKTCRGELHGMADPHQGGTTSCETKGATE